MRDRGGGSPGRALNRCRRAPAAAAELFFLSLFALLLAVAVEQINSSVKTSAQILDFN